MRLLARLVAVLAALSLALPASARTVYREVVVERFVTPDRETAPHVAQYGPFRVIDEQSAELIGATDERSPAAFRAMLRDYPGIARLEFVECPGTYDDRANLALGRLIRAAGMEAHVPAGGSVRSGAVELVLAGATVTIDDAAEFAVHAWRDEDGREQSEYRAADYENAKYLAYYREMGMAPEEAASFYAMTNSAAFAQPRWLTGAEMREWLGGGREEPLPRLAYLDLGPALN